MNLMRKTLSGTTVRHYPSLSPAASYTVTGAVNRAGKPASREVKPHSNEGEEDEDDDIEVFTGDGTLSLSSSAHLDFTHPTQEMQHPRVPSLPSVARTPPWLTVMPIKVRSCYHHVIPSLKPWSPRHRRYRRARLFGRSARLSERHPARVQS
jgi:hypothetical protein